jgi:hypothetical protein
MFPDDIRKLLRRQPFRAFRLVLTNNFVYEIRHPEMAQVSRSLLQIGFPSAEGETAERHVGVGLLHIVQYEFLTPSAGTVSPGAMNGPEPSA